MKSKKTVPIGSIKPYAFNPRNNDAAVEKVAESIRRCGYINPIIVDEDGIILAGHTRYKALLLLGETEAEVIEESGLTDEQKAKYRLLDNKTGEFAEWDQNKLAVELQQVDFQGFDFGFEDYSVNPDEFGTEFSLPDGDQQPYRTMTLTFSSHQLEIIEAALDKVEIVDDFGNTDATGNALYEVAKQWVEQRTSL